MICFDVTNKKSFDAMDMWLREASKFGGETLPVIVVGCKLDQASSRAVSKLDAERWVDQRKFAGYVETSAEGAEGVRDLEDKLNSI